MVRPHLQQIHNEAHAAKELARDLTGLKKVRLGLGIMCTVAPTQLIELLTSVQTRANDIEIEIADASARELEACRSMAISRWRFSDRPLARSTSRFTQCRCFASR
jgi:DNA-binding transcriptional LysR family regulator